MQISSRKVWKVREFLRTFATGTTRALKYNNYNLIFMKIFAAFISHLEKFKEERQRRLKDLCASANREEYAKVIAKCFLPCAQSLLAGHFRIVSLVDGRKCVRDIYPTVLELYYHEEGDGNFKDPIMYHTNDRKRYEFYKDKYEELKDRNDRQNYFEKRGIVALPYYPVGTLNPHPSGIDITFENLDDGYRASCLIRRYSISFNGGDPIDIENSTDLYDDMLLNGITLDNADWIEWVDGTPSSIVVTQSERKNVSAYEKYNDSPELWRKVVIGHKADNKPIFAKCTFPWQFAKK